MDRKNNLWNISFKMQTEFMHSKNQFNSLIHIGSVVRQFKDIDLTEALSVGQIESKKWLIDKLEELQLSLGTIYVLGGWWGILPSMIFESGLQFEKIRSFDIDPSCALIADTMNRRYVIDSWKFKASTANMLDLNYVNCTYTTKRADGSELELNERPDTIINTSCEHIKEFSSWWNKIPYGKLVVLQSNNLFGVKEHLNCSKDLSQFEAATPFSKLYFSGEHELTDYTRFMRIGLK